MNATESTWQIKMLYDGQCPLCSREVALLRRGNARGMIAFEDISGLEFDAGRYGLTMAEVVGSMHAVRPDGSVVRGIDVFAEVYEAVGWRWLAWLIRWRVTRPVTKLGYGIFAKVRPWFSGFGAGECAEVCQRGRGMQSNSLDGQSAIDSNL